MLNKKYLFLFLACALMLISCGKTSEKGNETVDSKSEFSMAALVDNYLEIKDALVENDGEKTAKAGVSMLAALDGMNEGTVPADAKEDYDEIMDDIRENAEHIRDNADHIAHLREHLEFLSKDVADLLELFEAPGSLFQLRCGEFNDGRGAEWISASENDGNPYLGVESDDCSEVIREFR